MKIILASAGLASEEIIREFERLIGKSRENANVVMINEAIKGETGDHRWFTDELTRLASVVGGNLEFVDLQAQTIEYIGERIDAADAVFCFGGNTDYLANVFMKTGFEKILPKILEEKVWVGSSAGSCVLCHQESAEISMEVYNEPRTAERFMNIVPLVFLPHLHGWFKFDVPEIIKTSKMTDLPVYALSDRAAVVVEDSGVLRVVGADYIVAKNGEVWNEKI